jgi:ketosteroid isomerase-like protein
MVNPKQVNMNNTPFSRRHFLTSSTPLSFAIGVVSATLIAPAYTEPAERAVVPGRSATPRQVAEAYWRAEAERDVEKVGQYYHADAIFMPPGERLVGWDTIRKWYEATYRKFHGVQVDIVHEISQGNESSLEWKATLTDATGAVITPVGVNIVRVEEGKFREVRAYFDSSILR